MVMQVFQAVDAFLPIRDMAFRHPLKDVRWPCMSIRSIPSIFHGLNMNARVGEGEQ